MNIFNLLKEHQLTSLFRQGQFGIEKENIRVTPSGDISDNPHPKIFQQKDKHPYITRDFAESQIELITPVCQNIHEACDFIKMLHHVVALELDNEYLWPYSQPPRLPQDLSNIAIAQFRSRQARQYREYLSEKYGKARQLLSGIHFNFSFTPAFLAQVYSLCPNNHPDYQTFCNQVYLKMARFYLKHHWLIVFLCGQGHVTHQSYPDQADVLAHRKQLLGDAMGIPYASSKRKGIEGYRNLSPLSISYQSLDTYIRDIKGSIKEKEIESLREYYSAVRLKTHGPQTLNNLAKQGIHYLEIRTLDLNPLEIEGISEETLNFLHLFLLFGLCTDDDMHTPLDYQQALNNQFLVADEDSRLEIMLQNNQQTISLKNWGNKIFLSMLNTFSGLNFPDSDIAVIKKFHHLLQHPHELPRFKILNSIQQQGFQSYFLHLAQNYYHESQKWCYQLYGYHDLELSTQILIREAIHQGIRFNILDRQDNFLEFHGNKTSQWVKQATKTALDNYITFLVMENKNVTKTLVARKNLIVPIGDIYQQQDKAKLSFSFHANHDIVIKPNMTNFGLGVTILKHPFKPLEFNQAIEHAFSYDEQILIEQYFPGKEFRFLVIEGRTIAVLHREPANVIGDGKHTIQELIAKKNQDPRRGHGYKKPLEQIQIDNIVMAFLKKQNLGLDTIPQADKKIYLRENSNVSTGGDSIDYTDDMPQVYKKLAAHAAEAVDAKICGVDMIIQDYQNKNPQNNYCILELNFNPAIQMHTFPFIGKDRKVAKQLLKALHLI